MGYAICRGPFCKLLHFFAPVKGFNLSDYRCDKCGGKLRKISLEEVYKTLDNAEIRLNEARKLHMINEKGRNRS